MGVNINQYGLTNAESIRTFINFWPNFQASFLEAWEELSREELLIYPDESIGFSWCHFYELPVKNHIALLLSAQSEDSEILEIFSSLALAPDQIAIIPELANQVDERFDNLQPPTKDQAIALMPAVGAYFGLSLSVYHSLVCVLYYGCFLNDLIRVAKSGNDKALFDAIRIDPAVIGCKTFTNRLSKAVLLKDKKFIKELRNALLGKHGSLDQANLQKMRLVIEILNEAKVTLLSDEKLHYLFVEVLNLYTWNEREGGNAKALRKFVNTYMSKNSTT